MKTLGTHCRVCGSAMSLEYDPDGFFSEAHMSLMATCDKCFDKYEHEDRIRRSSPTKERLNHDRETKWNRTPFKD